MATMVARGSSPLASSISIQEKGSRNKRKFRADPPISDPTLISPSLHSDCANFNLCQMNKSPEITSIEPQQGMCDLCTIHPYYGLRDEEEQEQFHDAEWNDKTESELEETVLRNLNNIFKTAIKTIMSHGYNEEITTTAVLRTGLCFGTKDTFSSIVENALVYLRSGHEVDLSLKENSSEELKEKQLSANVVRDLSLKENSSEVLKEKQLSALHEMVSVVRDFRPSFSRGDAMWRLLISDMDVYLACGMGSVETPACSSVTQLEQDFNTSSSSFQTMSELNALGSNKTNLVLPYPQNTKEPDMPTMVGIPSLPCGRFSASTNTHNPAKENATPSVDCLIEVTSSLYISQPSPSEGKPSSCKKGHLSISNRESVLRQKTVPFEKSYRMFGSKAAIRAGKRSGLGGLLLDKKSRAISDCNAINMKDALIKLSKAVGSDAPQADPTLNLSFRDVPVKITTTSTLSTSPLANTELSLSLSNTSNCENWIPQDKMDEMLQKLIPRAKDLEGQLQEWSDWGQQKVMEAARRLGKDKAELQSLRLEKEEVARLRKEKQSLEENTRKKLAEMEIALSKASAQVEKYNEEAREKDLLNIMLRKEMEAARRQAAESAASLQEVSKREMKILKKLHSWERQKTALHEELAAEKKKLSQLQQQLKQAKEQRDHLKARWKQEEKAKEEVLAQRNILRIEREQIELSGRSKENAMRLKAQTDLQKHREDVRKLEQQIAQLRQKKDSSKIAALKWGTDGIYASHLSDLRKESGAHITSKLLMYEELEEVERERECVMCLAEEMSVVFLPCAHQVVCTTCNEIHEKQGMKDCPSCRANIEKRIIVRSADS